MMSRGGCSDGVAVAEQSLGSCSHSRVGCPAPRGDGTRAISASEGLSRISSQSSRVYWSTCLHACTMLPSAAFLGQPVEGVTCLLGVWVVGAEYALVVGDYEGQDFSGSLDLPGVG
jgi:hypothetical protein